MDFPKNVSVAALMKLPFFWLNHSDKGEEITGTEGHLLQLLAEKLGFKFSIHFPSDGALWGIKKDDGNWTGITGMIARKEADMAFVFSSIRYAPSEVVDFSASYYASDKTFATDLPGPAPRYTILVFPFKFEVWITIFCTMIFFHFVQYIMFYKKNSKADSSGSKKLATRSVDSLKYRILDGSWIASNAFLKFIYTSVLLSFLTVELRMKGIRNTVELAEAMSSGNYICLMEVGNVMWKYLVESNFPHYRVIGEEIHKNSRTYFVPDYQYKPFGHSIAAVAPRVLFKLFYGSTKFISEDSLEVVSTGIMIRKGFCCSNRLNTVLLRITSAGLYQKFVQDVGSQQEIKLLSVLPYDESVKSLTLEALSGIFILLLAGYVASFLILLLEIMQNNFSKKKYNKISSLLKA
ncbi:lig_chan-Glu_bd domain-containing protein [Nephila pilipes]|uniref:Lig_chan-Glu_bd domain-containing protein n=1 Tax=Nephila pilipes TaxID=299642 RepID=A0A8X6NWW5_NEPPI|nr:lig_chan-Glu_bd domain-containing protein [Nephila pilipes]